MTVGACGAKRPPVFTNPPHGGQRDALLDKLAPALRERYVTWRDHHSERDRVHAEAIVERWQCKDASYDEQRGVSRCVDMPAPTNEEYAQLEAARLVLDPHIYVAVWLESEQAALALESEGIHLWSNHRHPKIQRINAGELHRTVFQILIFPLALDHVEELLARPGVICVRHKSLDSVDPPDEPF